MPEELPQNGNTDVVNDVEQQGENAVIDGTLFTPSDNEIVYAGIQYFSNLPGMVLVMDQNIHWGGAHLSYVNKANMKEYYFCFDPLCDHMECPTGYAGFMIWPWYFVWSPASENLYALCADSKSTLRTDGALYRVDMYTQEIKQVVPTDGNKITAIYATNDHIYLKRERAESGINVIRFDPLTEKYETIAAPQGKIFWDFCISGETVLVRFIDESCICLTTLDFEEYTPISLQRYDFIVGTTAYSTADFDGNYILDMASQRTICRYDLLSDEVKILTSFENAAVECVGCDGDYIYYILWSLADGDPEKVSQRETTLYRISVDGGEPEPMLDFCKENTGLRTDFYATHVQCFDGVLYAVLSQVVSDGLADIYGVISVEDGQWRFDTLSAGDEP
ncbi:MAG: hypothetical protein IJW40_09310 [Clostridia bacterium]|nr:hypothetical protein [Clostridia bacterium]